MVGVGRQVVALRLCDLRAAYRLSAHDAEDIFQEAFARLYEHLPSLREPDAIRPWVGQVTRRLCIDRLRAAGRLELTPEHDLGGVDHVLESLAEALVVRQALELLPEASREVLDRFFCRDESYHTIGEALGVPPGTIASRISRGLAQLRESLVDEL